MAKTITDQTVSHSVQEPSKSQWFLAYARLIWIKCHWISMVLCEQYDQQQKIQCCGPSTQQRLAWMNMFFFGWSYAFPKLNKYKYKMRSGYTRRNRQQWPKNKRVSIAFEANDMGGLQLMLETCSSTWPLLSTRGAQCPKDFIAFLLPNEDCQQHDMCFCVYLTLKTSDVGSLKSHRSVSLYDITFIDMPK